MEEWKNDDELFALIRSELFTAVVGDILDKLGYLHQFLPPALRPLHDKMVMVGRAMTVLEADIDQISDSRLLKKPFGLMLEALDDLKKNEVYICSGASPTYALWGELMATRARLLGAAGAVVDGYSRDTSGILAMEFPCFSYGGYAQDQEPRGKVVNYRVPIHCGQVLIEPGDIVFGDRDGVCVIPQKVEREVLVKAFEKARAEKMVKTKIEEGMNACDAFSKYGVI
ncbi:RraA family protein [Agriterribacter sp.]|mgnify:CR=1 FL=1|uniref:RraA family protein n=1 Tax=Agriterribacter sp. TaxID=2821509 RepID=UPI002C570939|nr:RraA family protein [Agriterribacter sp.]HRP54437.1 RraA family protein [Agriterribacter sp.]